MRYLSILNRLFLVVVLSLGMSAGLVRVSYADGPASVADLAERLLDAVVNISTTRLVEDTRGNELTPQGDGPTSENEDSKDRPQRRASSLGSGFVISTDGLIVTNNHVIEGADEVFINFHDGSRLEAKVIGADAKTDLAVLKVEPEDDLVAVALGDGSKARIGDWVMAIGNPFGLGGSVSIGIVSARNRDISSGPYDNFIQTDAAINQGNSGGPLFDMDGNVIGINSAIIARRGGSVGIGFAIPIELAKPVIAQLSEYGETRRGWLGVSIQNVSEDIAESLGLNSTNGALVIDTVEGGPSRGIIESGDIILTFDGKALSEMRDLPRMVAETPVGKEVSVEVFRGGETVDVIIVLGRLEKGELLIAQNRQEEEEALVDETAPVILLGMTLSELNDEARESFEIGEDATGLVVTEVDPDSQAAEKGIRPGTLIIEVNQIKVDLPGDAQELLEMAKDDGRKSVLLRLIDTRGGLRFAALKISVD